MAGAKWIESRKPIPHGTKFGRLTVVEQTESDKTGKRRYTCICQCGNKPIVSGDHLKRGDTVSCGCYIREKAREVGSRVRTHGECSGGKRRKSPEYKLWGNMISRCYNPKDISFPNYGGREIKVCDRWRSSFEAFLADVGRRPSPSHSLDRFPNKDGDYCLENVRWATAKEQQRNMRSNRLLTVNGETRCVAEWAEITGIGDGTIRARLKANWPLQRLFEQPLSRRECGLSEKTPKLN